MIHDSMKSCIDACNECAVACDNCASACLREDDVQTLSRCISLDIDCAEVCRVAAAMMTRDSEFTQAICAVCADVCDACAAECEQYDYGHCQQCAQACRHCAEECRRVADTTQFQRTNKNTSASMHL